MDKKELYWIKKFNSLNPSGYNIELEGNNCSSREIREKIALSKFGKLRGKEFSNSLAIARRPQGYPNIVSPEGKIFSDVINLKEFCIKHGLNQEHMCSVVNGKRLHHKGWHLIGIDPVKEKRKIFSKAQRSKDFPLFISPTGEVCNVETSLSEFCREKNLCVSNMSMMANNKIDYHKGWRLYNERG